tara:strand:- start:50176 stop:50319 length:144 start_codon:yes stop_codon:yes gene_type:complete
MHCDQNSALQSHLFLPFRPMLKPMLVCSLAGLEEGFGAYVVPLSKKN